MAPWICAKKVLRMIWLLTIGILVASGQIKAEDVDKYIIMGNFPLMIFNQYEVLTIVL
jgi:magnesium chelatase family protein